MARDICKIIIRIYNLIPDNDDVLNMQFKDNLKDIMTSIPYSAPEKLFSNYYWILLENIVNNYISEDDYNDINKPYCKEIINILTDKE